MVDLYQTSHKEEGKSMETNFIEHNHLIDTHWIFWIPLGMLEKRVMILWMIEMSILFNFIMHSTIDFIFQYPYTFKMLSFMFHVLIINKYYSLFNEKFNNFVFEIFRC